MILLHLLDLVLYYLSFKEAFIPKSCNRRSCKTAAARFCNSGSLLRGLCFIQRLFSLFKSISYCQKINRSFFIYKEISIGPLFVKTTGALVAGIEEVRSFRGRVLKAWTVYLLLTKKRNSFYDPCLRVV